MSVPAQVLFDGDAKVLCGVCGLKCVAVELVGVLQDLPGSGDRQCTWSTSLDERPYLSSSPTQQAARGFVEAAHSLSVPVPCCILQCHQQTVGLLMSDLRQVIDVC